MDTAPRTLAIIVPCYNEEASLGISLPRMADLLRTLQAEGRVGADSYILCVDDGSTDATWQAINEAIASGLPVRGIRLAHNSGHQNALMAGLDATAEHCDMSLTIDADLQDSLEVVGRMIDKTEEGAEVVYGVRNSRPHDTRTKRSLARCFYRLRSKLTHENVNDHGDFRLLTSAVQRRLVTYRERNLYLRGLIPFLTDRTADVEYERQPRVAGKSKYSAADMVRLALDGITAFTTRPIRAIIIIGLVLLFIDLAVSVYVLISYFNGDSIRGWTSIMLSVWFLGSLLLLAVGMVGEYIGRIYEEVKRRPRYLEAERAGWE